jgi:predicted dehydrogenase/threonine dehydrogenase-like Zn-dependent dehydrogenase
MLQVFVKKGKVITEDIPAPIASEGSVLIKVFYSCISAGTELSTVKDSNVSLIKKVIEKPERIISGFKMLSQLGFSKSITEIKDITDHSTPIGYSLSGVVLSVGEGVDEFEVGDYVAAAGAGLANHAEFVNVPKNLVVKCPDGIDMKKASTVTLGAISMHGVRRSNLSIGDYCAVFGTGILGLISIQILTKMGVRVIAVDIDDRRLEIAKKLGAEVVVNSLKNDPIKTSLLFTKNNGVDSVLFSANVNSGKPLSQAFNMCKPKGKVVMLGKAKLEIDRKDVYKKELDLITSTSYGPGRYDDIYEKKGIDYPYSYVRWTEKRNLEEFLRLISVGDIVLDELIEKEYPIDNAEKAFDELQSSEIKPLIVLLNYNSIDTINDLKEIKLNRKISIKDFNNKKGIINVAIIGAGPFAKQVHIPNFKRLPTKFNLYALMSRNGLNTKNTAKNNDFNFCTTSYDDILNDKNVDLVFITSNHKSHAKYVLEALKAGKNVFVEKPLAINKTELDKIKNFYNSNENQHKPMLTVGFNRRFSDYANKIKSLTKKSNQPLFIHYRMNAGFKDTKSLIFDEGGRIVGEACHIIDLMSFITESKLKSISWDSLSPNNSQFLKDDNKSIILKYQNGSICTIHYFAVGSNLLEKEYMEIHFENKTIILNDYKSLSTLGIDFEKFETEKSEKGHIQELNILYDYLSGKRSNWPIDLNQLIETTEATFTITSN